MLMQGSNATFAFTYGTITLSGSANNAITGVTGTETFLNGSGSTLSGAGTISNLAFINQGTVNANNLTITPNASGVTNGGTVGVEGGGSLTINGVNGAYTQSGGITNVDGTLSALSIAINGGTLSGTGSVDSAFTKIGGTLMPGDSGSAGTLSITGNVELDGIFKEQIGGTGAGQYSAADINGNLTLGGDSTVLLSFLNGFTPGQNTFTILNVTGGIVGDFSNNEFTYDDETWYVLICSGAGTEFCSTGDPSVILTDIAPTTPPATAPEPMALVLAGVGLLVLGFGSRRFRRDVITRTVKPQSDSIATRAAPAIAQISHRP